jgi:hypothetical protein
MILNADSASIWENAVVAYSVDELGIRKLIATSRFERDLVQ